MRAPDRAGLVTILAACLPPLAIYAFTLQPGLPAGDSGELITAAAGGGVAHPPGYPLYTMLLGAWLGLLPLGEAAWRANLLSAVCAAGACAVLAAAVFRLTRSRAGALLAAWAFATSAPTWQNAVVAEVFALNALLAACVLLAFARATDTSAPSRAPILALVLLATLALSHHHTLLLLALPASLVALSREWRADPSDRRRLAIGLAAVVALGLTPLIWLPIASHHAGALVWGDASAPRGFLALVTRADYGSLRLDPADAAMRADRSHLAIYLESLPRVLGVLPLALAVVGVLVTVARRRSLALVLGVFAAGQAWFFSRVGFPSDVAWLRGVIERFYILPDLVLAALAGLGFAWTLERLPRRSGTGIAALALCVTLAVPLARHPRAADQRGNVFADALGRAVLASLPPNTVLFIQGDLLHNALAYLTRVRRMRPDVTVLDQELMTYDWYVRRVRSEHPGLLPAFGRAQRLRLRDGRVLEGIAIPRGDSVDVIAESAQGTLSATDLVSAADAPAESLFRASRAGFRHDVFRDPGEDRYSGLPGSRNLLWFDRLAGRRPVAMIGAKDDSYTLRYELTPMGLVERVDPAGRGPGPAEQLAAALTVFERAEPEACLRAYDPASFEAAERRRFTDFVARAALLCCQPGAAGPIAAHPAGHARLLDFARRFESLEPVPDPNTLRSIGFLRALDPASRDTALGRRDLERYRATSAEAAADPEVRAFLAGPLPALR